jgi:dihydrofolate reductase
VAGLSRIPTRRSAWRPRRGWATPAACSWVDGRTRTSTGSGPSRPTTFTEVLDNSLKYVASTTLEEPLAWKNSKLLAGDAAKAVAKLKQKPGKDLVILGSGELVHSLMRDNLIDEFILLIHPLILGSGHRLFRDGGTLAGLQLIDSKTSATGVVIATYRPAQPATPEPA